MKYLVNILTLLLIAVIAFFAIQKKNIFSYQPTKDLIETTGTLVNVTKHNLAEEVTPSRQSRVTFIEKEATLRIFAPDLFSDFDEDDWQKFWAIIYKPVKDKNGMFVVKRYRTKQEIQEILIARYPDPFSFLQKQYWDMFWQDIIGLDPDKGNEDPQ